MLKKKLLGKWVLTRFWNYGISFSILKHDDNNWISLESSYGEYKSSWSHLIAIAKRWQGKKEADYCQENYYDWNGENFVRTFPNTLPTILFKFIVCKNASSSLWTYQRNQWTIVFHNEIIKLVCVIILHQISNFELFYPYVLEKKLLCWKFLTCSFFMLWN